MKYRPVGNPRLFYSKLGCYFLPVIVVQSTFANRLAENNTDSWTRCLAKDRHLTRSSIRQKARTRYVFRCVTHLRVFDGSWRVRFMGTGSLYDGVLASAAYWYLSAPPKPFTGESRNVYNNIVLCRYSMQNKRTRLKRPQRGAKIKRKIIRCAYSTYLRIGTSSVFPRFPRLRPSPVMPSGFHYSYAPVLYGIILYSYSMGITHYDNIQPCNRTPNTRTYETPR